MGTLKKLTTKAVIKAEETRKEHEKVINDITQTKDNKQKKIRTVGDIMRDSVFYGSSPIYFPKKHKR